MGICSDRNCTKTVIDENATQARMPVKSPSLDPAYGGVE